MFEWTEDQSVSVPPPKNLVKRTNTRCKHPSFTGAPTPLNGGIYFYFRNSWLIFTINNNKKTKTEITKLSSVQTKAKAKTLFFPLTYKTCIVLQKHAWLLLLLQHLVHTSCWLLNFKGTLIALHASTDLHSIEICDPLIISQLQNTKTLTKLQFL